MIELSVGTRFRYNGRLYEVVDMGHEYVRCSECNIFGYECSMMACIPMNRKDGKYVCFKWVEE